MNRFLTIKSIVTKKRFFLAVKHFIYITRYPSTPHKYKFSSRSFNHIVKVNQIII